MWGLRWVRALGMNARWLVAGLIVLLVGVGVVSATEYDCGSITPNGDVIQYDFGKGEGDDYRWSFTAWNWYTYLVYVRNDDPDDYLCAKLWNGDIIVGEDCSSCGYIYPDHWVVSAVPEGKTYDAKAGFYTLKVSPGWFHGGRAWVEVDYATQINLGEEKSGTLGPYPKHGAALYWIYLYKGKKYQILFDASGDDIYLWVYKCSDCTGTGWYDACTWEDAIESYDPDSDWQEFSPPASDTYIFVVTCPAKYDITYHLKIREKPNEPPEVSKVWADIKCEWGRDEIIVYAEASDPDGEVTQVEFQYSTDHSTWHNIGTDYTPEYGKYDVWWDTSSIKEDSSVWIRARAKDDKGAYSPWKEAGPYKIDNKPPSTTHSISPSSPNGDNGWYTSCVDIYFSASDTGSGVDCTFFKIDDGPWMRGNKIEDFCDECKHTIEYYSRDKACDYHGVPGNEEEPKSFTLKIDRNKPTASISINNGAEYTNSRSVTLYLDYDDSCSGVWKVRYKNEGGSWTSWENPSSKKSWTLPSGDGRKRVCYQVKDHAGWLSDVVYDDIFLDTKPPSASCTLSPPSPDGENGWYVSPVKVTLSASDPAPGSGVKKIHYRIDGGRWQESASASVTLTVSSDGEHRIEYYAEDNAGNKGETKTCEFRIDTAPPSVIIRCPPDWINTTKVTISWAGSDMMSGIAGYYYNVDSGPESWTTSTSVTLAVSDGIHKICVRAKDNAGNIGDYSCCEFKVDTTPPSSKVKELPKVQTSTTFTVSWEGSDALSGIRCYDVQYKVDDGDWVDWLLCTTETSATFAGEPGHTYCFRCRAKDNAGNWESYPTTPDTCTKVPKPGVALSCDEPVKTVKPGKSVTFDISVKNTGEKRETILLLSSVSGTPAGWAATLSKDRVVLNAGASELVILTVTAPDAESGSADITVYAEVEDNPEFNDSVTVHATISVSYGVELGCKDNEHYVMPGESTDYIITVKNTGELPETIDFSLSSPPAGWTASLSRDSMTLDIGESKDVVLTVTAPEDAEEGDSATIIVTGSIRGHEEVYDSVKTVTTVIIRAGDMTVTPVSWSPTVRAGESVSVNFTVSAVGGAVKGVSVTASGPSWLTVAPESLGDIHDGESKEFTATATPPEGVSGTFPYRITVSCEQGSPPSVSISGSITVVANLTPTVKIRTDKEEYQAGDYMLISICLKNPTGAPATVFFLWEAELPDYGVRIPIVTTTLTLPAGFDKCYVFPLRLPRLNTSFHACWHAALYDPETLEIIDESRACWLYHPVTQ